MGRKKKLQRFADLARFPNVFENFDPSNPGILNQLGEHVELKGKWREVFFRNPHPIVVELACGKAEFSLSMAKKFPDLNFIGVDIKGARIWKGASIALNENLNNIAFLRTRIEQLDFFFGREEVNEIWITFPDPFLRKSKENRRLTAPNFVNLYRRISKPNTCIHLKTDSPELFDYTFHTIRESSDCTLIYSHPSIYDSKMLFGPLHFKTYYEKMHLKRGKTIRYLKFILDPTPKIKKD